MIKQITKLLSALTDRFRPKVPNLIQQEASPMAVPPVTPEPSPTNTTAKPPVTTINGKPVLWRAAKSVLNMKSHFEFKLLCTGPVLNLGEACVFGCLYCYVADIARKFIAKTLGDHAHEEVVVRRLDAIETLRKQLKGNQEKHKFHVVFSSSLVDICATMELLRETAEACTIILEETVWDIRLLTKSAFLPQLVKLIDEKYHHRLILGVSTGTFDDELGKVIEPGTALVSKRIASLHWLQDNNFRTFAMVCPSLPQEDYDAFARQAKELLRYEKCEHVWAEVINVRGDSFLRTIEGLDDADLIADRDRLAKVCGVGAEESWEVYARLSFEAHERNVEPGKLRFMQYVSRDKNLPYWLGKEATGAVVLGTAKNRAIKKAQAKQAEEEAIKATKLAKLTKVVEALRLRGIAISGPTPSVPRAAV